MTADFERAPYDDIPKGSYCFALAPNQKAPGTPHAHHDAIPSEKFAPLSNYGIRLDNQWVLVDFDAEHAERKRWEVKLQKTWMQQTRRGTHRLYTLPDGFDLSTIKNTKIVAVDDAGIQTIIGDIKCRGYLVGPGSVVDGHVYTMIDPRPPIAAPTWLLDAMRRSEGGMQAQNDGSFTVERSRIELGANDDELVKMAGFWRGRGFSEAVIAQMLGGIIDSGVLEQDPTKAPYTHFDALRIAKSAANWKVGSAGTIADIRLLPDEWQTARQVSLVGAVREWWMHGFVPKRELVLLYGAGGIGKSSWGSEMAALVTKADAPFVHVGVEESFEEFAARAVLLGANRDLLIRYPLGSALLFPRDAAAMSDALGHLKAGMLYLDSVYTHFEAQQGSNAAERARRSLAPLAEIAKTVGCTVMGVFHENKAGDWLGSAEMSNVARALLHFTRKEGQPLRVSVRKTNGRAPDYALDYEGVETVWSDPETGEVQMEMLDDGTTVPATFVLPGKAVKVKKDTVTIQDINVGKQEKRDAKRLEALKLKELGLSVTEIATQLGIHRVTASKYLNT